MQCYNFETLKYKSKELKPMMIIKFILKVVDSSMHGILLHTILKNEYAKETDDRKQ